MFLRLFFLLSWSNRPVGGGIFRVVYILEAVVWQHFLYFLGPRYLAWKAAYLPGLAWLYLLLDLAIGMCGRPYMVYERNEK